MSLSQPDRFITSSHIQHAAIIALFCVFAFVLGMFVTVLGVLTIAVVAIVIVLPWILLEFRVGVVLAMLMMPLTALVFFPHELFGVRGLNPMNVILLATGISYIVHAGFRGWRDPLIPTRLLLWYLLPFTVAAYVGMSKVGLIPSYYEINRLIQFTNGTGYIRDMYFRPLLYIALALLVGLAVRHSQKPEKYIVPMLASGWIYSCLILWLIVSSGVSLTELASPGARTFLSALGMHANEISLLLNMLYAITLFSIHRDTGSAYQNILFVSAVLFGIAILLTFSRGGFAGFLLINSLYFYKRLNWRTVLAGLAVVTGLGYFLLDAFLERTLTGVQSGDQGAVTAGRIDDIWLPLLPYVLADPVMPHGMFSILWSEPIRLNRMQPFGQTHSAWLGGLMDYGLIGFGFMIAFLLYVRKEFSRLAREHASTALQGLFAGAAVTIPVWFVQGLTDDRFTPTFSQSYFWMALGILMGCGGVFRAKTRGTGAQ